VAVHSRKYRITAKIVDEEWLAAFHGRKISLLSGDAFQCKVTFIYQFDEGGTMIDEKIEIVKVLDVIRGPGGEQLPLQL
jgi:2-C-methyl-D-erythritol 4-phosphate cytidylyltransferase